MSEQIFFECLIKNFLIAECLRSETSDLVGPNASGKLMSFISKIEFGLWAVKRITLLVQLHVEVKKKASVYTN